MMSIKIFLSFLFLFGFVQSQPFTINLNFISVPANGVYGIPSNDFIVGASSLSNNWFSSITLTCAQCSSIVPSSFLINSTFPQFYFSIIPTPTTLPSNVQVIVSSSNGDTFNPNNIKLNTVGRTVSAARQSANSLLSGSFLVVGENATYSMSTDWPVMGTLTISITSTKGLVTIDPLQLVFNSGDFLKSFSITANDIGFETLNFALGGSDANFTNFSAGANTAPFTIIYRSIVPPLFPNSIPTISNFSSYFYTFDNFNTEDVSVVSTSYLDVIPSSSVNYVGNPSDNVDKNFQFSSDIASTKTVNFALTGTNSNLFNLQTATSTFTVVKRNILFFETHSELYVNLPAPITVSTPLPPQGQIIATVASANANVNPSQIYLSPSNTSFLIMVTPLAPGYVTLEWSFEGPELITTFARPAQTYTFGVQATYPQFFLQPNFPTTLYPGIESIPTYLCLSNVANYLPSYSVNVRFSTRWFATAVPITFTPSVLSFQNGGPLCQNFTFQATENPLSTNSFNLVFTLDGPSALWFNAPNLPKIITVVSRSVQVYTPSSTWQLGLTQTISISVNYPPSTWIDVEVYAPEIQFNVSKVTLTSSQPYAELQGTPYTIGTNVAIRNFVGGPDGGWYTTSTVFLNSISFRTIEIQRIYTAAEIQYYPNMIQTTNNFTLNYPDVLPTVFTVVLSAPVTNSLTIQPTATQLSFVPSTLTLSPGATTMQFQVRGFTGGVHTTNFILSGPDAPYYSNIQGPIQFTVVKGGLTPYYTLSAASFVSTNVSLILSLTIFLLFNLF